MSICFFVGTFRFRNVRLTGWLEELFKTKWRNLQMAPLTMLQNINLTVFIHRNLFRARFCEARISLYYTHWLQPLFSSSIWRFMFISVKAFWIHKPKQWSVQSAIVNRAWLYKDQNRRDIFFLADNGMEFILIWHPYLLHHLNLF